MADWAKLRPYASLIREQAAAYDLDPNLIAGLVWFESGANPTIRSAAGAVGLGQIMPSDTHLRNYDTLFADRPTSEELEDPALNLDWSARIIKQGLDRWGTEAQALAAYLGTINADGAITGTDTWTGVSGNKYVDSILALRDEVPADMFDDMQAQLIAVQRDRDGAHWLKQNIQAEWEALLRNPTPERMSASHQKYKRWVIDNLWSEDWDG